MADLRIGVDVAMILVPVSSPLCLNVLAGALLIHPLERHWLCSALSMPPLDLPGKQSPFPAVIHEACQQLRLVHLMPSRGSIYPISEA